MIKPAEKKIHFITHKKSTNLKGINIYDNVRIDASPPPMVEDPAGGAEVDPAAEFLAKEQVSIHLIKIFESEILH